MKNINTNSIFKISSNAEFEDLAYKIFEYQFQNNEIYNKYASLILKEKTPQKINQIPFLPISFFKTEEIICKNKKAKQIFKSSGTEGERSNHFIADIELYKASFKNNFISNYGNIEDLCIIGLLPSYQENGDSSLIFMMDTLIKISENVNSGFYGNNFEKLHNIIANNERKNIKTIVVGVTYALLDFANKFPLELKSTTIIETGGMKGKRKELLKEEVHKILCSAFKINDIHSEYGMTELLSQSYSKKNGIFTTPPWMKVLTRDVYDPLSINTERTNGGINIIDLANIYSCSFIATDDLGVLISENEFKLNGRISNADIRGCNQLIQ